MDGPSTSRWLCLLPWLLTVACVTTTSDFRPPPPTLEASCNAREVSACEAWGQQLLLDHEPAGADRAFSLACALGSTESCIKLGQLRMDTGDLTGAEPPLRKAYNEDVEEAALALAALYDARGDTASASHLRWEALALDKSTVEFVFGYRFAMWGDPAGTLDLNVQPMGLQARRLTLGVNLTFSQDTSSLNATVGYQHFLTNWTAPYVRGFAGPTLGERRTRLNMGAEVGMKLFAGPFGHLGVGVGSSIDGTTYTVVEAGLDWILTLYVLANLK